MGRRQKPRFRMVLPVSIWGTDISGKAFHQLGYTLDISTGGARLAGVLVPLRRGDIIAVRYKQRKARFRVVWSANQEVGIQYLEGERFIWIELPEEEFIDQEPVEDGPAPPAAAEPPPASAESSQAGIEIPPQETHAAVEAPALRQASTDELAATLQNCLATLRSLDGLVNSAEMLPQVAQEFHAAAGHLRNTAWAVQQWIELQQESRDPGAIIESVNSERVRFATQLCRALVQDRQHLVAGVSRENREALVAAVQRVTDSFGNPGHSPEQGRAAVAASHDPIALMAALNDEIRSSTLTAEETLELIVERARSFTGADGAAIALRDEDDMVCCATVGIAPLVGVRFSASGGLAGEAIAARRSVICRDAENDERVDAALCRSMDLRSGAIVPILARDSVVGVLQAFAGRPNAFNEASTSLLQHLAEFVASLEPNLRLDPDPR
jgi:putative methionine-R-sulfoxide reductase with GAF domain